MMGFILQDGVSSLSAACLNGHLDVVKTLIATGASIDQANKVSAHITTRASLLFKVTKLHHHVSQSGP